MSSNNQHRILDRIDLCVTLSRLSEAEMRALSGDLQPRNNTDREDDENAEIGVSLHAQVNRNLIRS